MFGNLKVRTRLILILVVSSIALLSVGALGLINGYRTRLEIERVYLGGVDKIEEITKVWDTTSEKIVNMVHRVLIGGMPWSTAQDSIREARDEIIRDWNTYANSPTELDDQSLVQQRVLKDKIQQSISSLSPILTKLNDILQRQDKEQLNTLTVQELNPQIDTMFAALSQLIEVYSRDSKADYAKALDNSAWFQIVTAIGLILSFLILIPLTIISSRGIIRPLDYAIECIAVSQDIVTSLSHLSAGAAETASAVTETTTTVEELKQTANISVDKAKDVLANAEETLQTVTASEQFVMSTIEDINQIRARMQIISDSILKFSEKSLAIAEIMNSVGDIAEQSNLLAVNAAIQAAKDQGEVGRSFSVVAQEIRTLAEQSKGATVQVRSLLNDIQTATNAAVLATEQGSKAVAKGVEQSTQTSKTIKELAGKMSRVTQAANQIVLSNQQQLVGTEQITIAMTQINEATGQHVTHLRQIETALATLNQGGETLKDLTDQTKRPSSPFRPTKTAQLIKGMQ